MNKSKALYAFSADPITLGHINVVERVSAAFESVVVAIGRNPSKKYMFSLNERLELAKASLSHLDNVEVVSFQGMVVDFACSQNANIIIKGVRNSADFDYENSLHQVGESQELGIDTHILFANPKMSHISSSTVKSIQVEHGDITSYVTLSVKAALEARISNQLVFGVTGAPACGKSTLTDSIIEQGKKLGIDVHNIDLDCLGHEIYEDLSIPLHQEITSVLIERYGSSVSVNGFINRKALAEIVFSDKKELGFLNQLVKKPMLILVRKALHGKKGVVLLNGALLVENNYLDYCNNKVIVVDVDKKTQIKRIMARGLTSKQAEKRIDAQKNADEKIELISEKNEKDDFGCYWRFNTSKESNDIALEWLSEIKDEYHSI